MCGKQLAGQIYSVLSNLTERKTKTLTFKQASAIVRDTSPELKTADDQAIRLQIKNLVRVGAWSQVPNPNCQIALIYTIKGDIRMLTVSELIAEALTKGVDLNKLLGE